MKKSSLSVLLSCFIASSTSFAGSGLFLNLNGSFIQAEHKEFTSPTALTKDDLKKDFAYTAGLGYSLSDALSVEADYSKRPELLDEKNKKTLIDKHDAIIAVAKLQHTFEGFGLFAGAGGIYKEFKSPAGYTIKHDKKTYVVKAGEEVKEYAPLATAGIYLRMGGNVLAEISANYVLPNKQIPGEMSVNAGFRINTYS